MALLVRFDVPFSYAEYLELNKVANPTNTLPPGCVHHVVGQNDQNGLTIVDLWHDEAKVMPFYEDLAKAVGRPLPPLTISRVHEVLS